MATKIVDTLLPTTMVGSYPRPHWFKHQLLGRDIRVAFKEVQHEEAYHDAVATVTGALLSGAIEVGVVRRVGGDLGLSLMVTFAAALSM